MRKNYWRDNCLLFPHPVSASNLRWGIVLQWLKQKSRSIIIKSQNYSYNDLFLLVQLYDAEGLESYNFSWCWPSFQVYNQCCMKITITRILIHNILVCLHIIHFEVIIMSLGHICNFHYSSWLAWDYLITTMKNWSINLQL